MSKLAHAGASSTTPSGFASSNAAFTASSSESASSTATAPASASRTIGLASPIAITPFARRASGSRRRRRPPPLQRPPNPPADDRHEAGVETLDGAQCRLDVGRLRVVDEPDTVDLGDGLHGVLE